MTEPKQMYGVIKKKAIDDGSRFLGRSLYSSPEEAEAAERYTKDGNERTTFVTCCKIRWKE